MHDKHIFAARRKHQARRHQRIRGLEIANQRQVDRMGFLPTLQYQLLAEPVAFATEQFEIRAKLANRGSFRPRALQRAVTSALKALSVLMTAGAPGGSNSSNNLIFASKYSSSVAW